MTGALSWESTMANHRTAHEDAGPIVFTMAIAGIAGAVMGAVLTLLMLRIAGVI